MRGASAPGDAGPSGTCQRGGSERVWGQPQKGKGWPSRAEPPSPAGNGGEQI